MRADKNNIKHNKKNSKFLKLTNIEVETINGGGFWSEVWEVYKKNLLFFLWLIGLKTSGLGDFLWEKE